MFVKKVILVLFLLIIPISAVSVNKEDELNKAIWSRRWYDTCIKQNHDGNWVSTSPGSAEMVLNKSGVFVKYYKQDGFGGILDEKGGMQILAAPNFEDNLSIPESLASYPVTGIISLWGAVTSKIIQIPKSVVQIDSWALKNPYLYRIVVHPDNPVYAEIDGVLFDKTTRTLVCYPKNKSADPYVVPEGITRIGDYSFYQASNLYALTIPDTVISIGDFAYCDCLRLQRVNLSNKLESIGQFSFSGIRFIAKALDDTKIELPDGMVFLGDYAFYNTYIDIISLPNTLRHIGTNPFASCRGLKQINVKKDHPTLVVSNNTLYDTANRRLVYYIDDGDLVNKEIRKGTLHIDSDNFIYSSIQHIVLPEGMLSIGDNVFKNVFSLETLDIPNGFCSVGKNSITGCSDLKTLYVPDSLTSIGEGSFFYNEELTLIVERDSAMHRYAEINHIPYSFKNGIDWLD